VPRREHRGKFLVALDDGGQDRGAPGAKLAEGCRLMCQFWPYLDLERTQGGVQAFRPAWQGAEEAKTR